MGNAYSESRVCKCQPIVLSSDNELGKMTKNRQTLCEDEDSVKTKVEVQDQKKERKKPDILFDCDKSHENAMNRGQEMPKLSPRLQVSPFNQVHGCDDSSFVLSDLTEQLRNLSTDGAGKDETEEIPKVHYYGWFFSPEISEAINAVVMYFYRSCLQDVSHFKKFMITCCKDADIRDPMEYYAYKRPGKRIKPDDELEYHVTAKFLGRVRDPEYQTLVQPFLNKSFYIHLVGIVFTPRTLGVRVRLTPAQQLMFDEKDEHRNVRRLSFTEKGSVNVQEMIKNELGSYSKFKQMHKSNPKCKFRKDESKITFKNIRNGCGDTNAAAMTTSRAHITIACAPKVLPKRTGDDLVEIIDLEQRPSSTNNNFQHDYEVNHGTLRQFGRQAEAFVLYPSSEMIVPGIFNCI